MLFGGWAIPAAARTSSAGVLVRPGTRGTVTRHDGNDAKGPLDLSGISIAQAASNQQVFTLTTISPFTIAEINLGANGVTGNFFVGIDTNNDMKLNYRLYLYNAHGLRGVLVRGNQVVLRNVKVSRPNRRSIQAKLSLANFGSPSNYWILAASASSTGTGCSQQKQCLDYIPNRYPLILSDVTPPVIGGVNIPGVATDTTYGVSFTVKDVGSGSGVRKWIVQKNVGGSWTEVTSGSTSGAISTQIAGAEGTQDELRVVATDRAGNTTFSSSQMVIVPFDDADAGVVYTHPGVDWSHPTTADAYRGASHLSSGAGSTVSLSFTGGSICIIGGPVAGGLGSAQISIDAGPLQTVGYENTSTPARTDLGCIVAGSVGVHTVIMTTDDVFNFDGFYVGG